MKTCMMMAAGLVAFLPMAAQAEEIVLSSGVERETLTVEGFYPPLPTDTGKTYGNKRIFAENRNLSDFILANAKFTASQGKVPQPATIVGYTETEGEWLFQVQWKDPNYWKGVKIRLFQEGANIMAQSLWARYCYAKEINHDLEVVYIGSMTVETINSGPGENWYGCQALTLRHKISDENFVTLGDREILDADTVTVADGTGVRVDETTSSDTPFAKSAVSFDGADALFVTNRPRTTLAATIVGNGVDVRLAGGEFPETEISTGGQAKLSNTGSGLLLATGTKLCQIGDLVSCDIYQDNSLLATDVRPGTNEGSTTRGDGGIFFIERTETNIVFQAQVINDNWNKCVYGEIYPSGTNVMVRRLKGYYSRAPESFKEADYDLAPLGTDMRKITCHTISSYTISNLVVKMTPIPAVAFTGDLFGMENATVTISGPQRVDLHSANALPNAGTVTIKDGSDVYVRKAQSENMSLRVVVGPGGRLIQSGASLQNLCRDCVIDGGELALTTVRMGDSGKDETGCYINNLVLMNGGRVTGMSPRVGYATCTWTILGTSPSYSSCGSLLVGGKSYTTYTVNFDVADVTGDAASDFIDSGYHQDFSTYNWGANVVKKGVGTWELRRAFGQTGYVKVNAGTLLAAVDDLVKVPGSLFLGGGCFAAAPGTVQNVKTLTLTENTSSTIAVGEGASVVFPDPESDQPLLYGDVSRKGLTLGAGARVNVTLADADASVRVGTSKCLTPAQLSAFRVNGHRALQDEAGYLVPSGSLLQIR